MGKIKQFWADFKKFISRGNVLDMAIGVIVASAFTAIVTALTNKIIMPCINWLLSLGGAGLDSAYTFLKITYQTDATGAFILDNAGNKIIDLANSIYIDWGAFITAILNFILVALVLFTVLRVAMNASNALKKGIEEQTNKELRAEKKAVRVIAKEQYRPFKVVWAEHLEEKKRLAEEKAKQEAEEKARLGEQEKLAHPSQEQLLTEILSELKKQNAENK